MMLGPTMKTPRPTDAELAILRVLWDRGPSTVRQVHDILMRERPTAYTTALKLLQIMTEKGLVSRDEADRTHIYHPRLSQEQTQRQLIRDLVDRAFGGSSSQLVLQALSAKRASAEELVEIRRLLDSRKFQDKTDGRASLEDTMTAIELVISQPVAHAIAWALLQFVWQGALIGILTARALVALRTSAADVRYVVATIGLSLMLTMPAVTAVQTWRGLRTRQPRRPMSQTRLGRRTAARRSAGREGRPQECSASDGERRAADRAVSRGPRRVGATVRLDGRRLLRATGVADAVAARLARRRDAADAAIAARVVLRPASEDARDVDDLRRVAGDADQALAATAHRAADPPARSPRSSTCRP